MLCDYELAGRFTASTYSRQLEVDGRRTFVPRSTIRLAFTRFASGRWDSGKRWRKRGCYFYEGWCWWSAPLETLTQEVVLRRFGPSFVASQIRYLL